MSFPKAFRDAYAPLFATYDDVDNTGCRIVALSDVQMWHVYGVPVNRFSPSST